MKMRLKEMEVNSQLKRNIHGVSFRYNTSLGGYTTLMSDRLKLGEIW